MSAPESDPVPESWRPALEPVLASAEARRLGGWLRAEEAAGKPIYPPRGMRLAALGLTPLEAVRVVILGQDPYHGRGRPTALLFGARGVKPPPSLLNIFKEMESDLGLPRPQTGDLTRWAEQGVLLLNNTLTVEAGQAGSHAGRGWDAITDACVAAVVEQRPSVRPSSCGAAMRARKRAGCVALASMVQGQEHHLVLTSPHPSPSVGPSRLLRLASLQPGERLS